MGVQETSANGPQPLHLPCGGTAIWEDDSILSYRCIDCGAVLGSIGQPKECVKIQENYTMWKKLGGMGWDYKLGKPNKDYSR